MFNLDTTAVNASDTFSSRVDKSGIFSGVITRAEWSKSSTSQAEFFNIDFKTDEGLEANYMSICFKKSDGTNAFGYNILNKIMACCALRSITSVDVDGKKVCPELTNARIRFALQAENDWYEDKNTGEQKPTVNMHISIPFKADTGQTAKEVMSNEQATAIDCTVVYDKKPKDKPLQTLAPQQQSWGSAPQQSASQMAPAYQQVAPQNNASSDDMSEIPF